jgi:aspartate carbamoyltransferase regulatory subunit
MRMALILKLLAEAEASPVKEKLDTSKLVHDRICTNPKCICQVEQELPQLAKLTDVESNTYRCIYCEQKV